jgi:hypothetical protein
VRIICLKKKKAGARCRPGDILFSFTVDLSTIDEQFHVLLRTDALIRMPSNALHEETSTSFASPPFS